MTKEQFITCLQHYLDGTATAQETAFLHAYYQAFTADRDVLDMLDGHEKEKLKLSIKAGIKQQLNQQGRVRHLARWRNTAAIAASILLVAGAGIYLLRNDDKPIQMAAVTQPLHIPAGGNNATLTLADGRVISVTDAKQGKLAVQGGVMVNKPADGKLNYQADNIPAADAALYNTLTTPRGGQYQMTLADGTKVWLNAASSIRFPVSFAGLKRRDVNITGEVYFEVVHNAKQPFTVTANGVHIEDLGTEFNVNAYADEPTMRTTLVAGSIKVQTDTRTDLIKPGQEAVIAPGLAAIKVLPANIEEAVAWKNGQTLFTNQDIRAIMRQVSRWYNVDVVFEGQPTKRRFDGGISRRSDLAAVLKILQLNHIKFEVKGRQITVRN